MGYVKKKSFWFRTVTRQGGKKGFSRVAIVFRNFASLSGLGPIGKFRKLPVEIQLFKGLK